MTVASKGNKIWLILLFLVLLSNFILYNTSFGVSILPEETRAVVLGSLFDLMIISPLLYMLYKKKFDVKTAILFGATGCIIARLIIPKPFLQPFIAVTWVGIAVEVAIVLFEILLVITFVRYLPKIIRTVKESDLPIIFSFPQAVDLYVKNNPIIHMICLELLTFYYALFSWKKKRKEGITLYRNSSYIAFQVMLIHAIVVETLGLHFWLHEKSLILSMVLLFFNIYGIIFLLGDIQAVRSNPVYFDEQAIYISLGLMKRAKIRFDEIEAVIENPKAQEKKSKDTIQFIASDLTTPDPHILLVMKKPITAIEFMGIERQYTKIEIHSDSPNELKRAIFNGIAKNKNTDEEDV